MSALDRVEAALEDEPAPELPDVAPVTLAHLPSEELIALGALIKTPRPTCTSCGAPLPSRGRDVVRWLQANCVFTKARWAGQPMKLTPTQVDIIMHLFATCCPCGRDVDKPGRRRYRWALVGVAKKAGLPGKTELMAGLGHYFLAPDGDGEPDPLVICGAGSDEQADLLYTAASDMVSLGPLKTKADAYHRSIHRRDAKGELKRVSAAAGTNDGPNISVALLDELHVWVGEKGRNVWTILSNGGVVREEPYVLQITTAGFNRKTICYEQYTHGRKVALDPSYDPRFFMYWRGAPMKWPIDDPRTWAIANAGYGTITNDAFYHDQLTKKAENDFRRYFLNQWTRSYETWLPKGAWEAGADEAPLFTTRSGLVLPWPLP